MIPVSRKRARSSGTAGRTTAATASIRYNKWKKKNYPRDEFYELMIPRGMMPTGLAPADTADAFGPSWAGANEAQRDMRRRANMIGRGKYNWKRGARRVGRGLGRAAMGLAKSELKALTGMGVYGGAGRRLGGRGEYTADAPISNTSDEIVEGKLFSAPHFDSGDAEGHDSGSVIFSNQEFVQTIYGNDVGTTFESLSFAVNPGMAEVFPMLSQFANNFENYELIQCAFHFETLLDEGVFQSSTGQVGQIYMYSHKNPTAADFQNPGEFHAAGAKPAATTKGQISGVECDPAQMSGLNNDGINVVRFFDVDNSEKAQYDQAKFQVAVSDTPDSLAGAALGRLYVSYKVRLIQPKLSSVMSRNQLTDIFSGQKSFTMTTQGGANHYFPMFAGVDTALVAGSKNTIGCQFVYTDRTSSSSDAVQIILPSWVRGLVRVTYSAKWLSAVQDEPSTSGDPAITTAGAVDLVTQTVTPVGGANYFYDYEWMLGRQLAADGEADSAAILIKHVSTYRVSQALSGDNSITITSPLTSNQHALNGAGTFTTTNRFTFVIELIQDYGTVGTQGLAEAVTMA